MTLRQKLRSIVPFLAIFVFVSACASLGSWLDEPATGVERGNGTVTVTDPETGVAVTAPVSDEGTATVPLPEGGEVSYTPPPPSDSPTKGDTVAGVAGGLLGMVLGNPTIGVLVTGALQQAIGAIPRKRKTTPVAA